MNAPTWSDIIQAGMLLVSTVLIPLAIWVYQKRTNTVITDQDRAAIYHARDTAAGIIETMLHKGQLAVSDVSPIHPDVIKEAIAAIGRVPDSAAAQEVTREGMAAMIAGRVDTAKALEIPAVAALQPVQAAKAMGDISRWTDPVPAKGVL